MNINTKILNTIKRKVNENRLRGKIKSILEASITRRFQKAVETLQKIQLDQQKLRKAFVTEKNPKRKEVLKKAIIKMHHEVKKAEEDFNRAMHVEPVDYIEDGKITEGGKVTRNMWDRMSDDQKIDALETAYNNPDEAMKYYELKWNDLPSAATQNMHTESIKELDVRKTHGDKRIENPATGNDIKLRTALKAKKGSAVYAKGKSMYNALKDKPANEGKLTEASFRPGDKFGGRDGDKDYKYKKYVSKAFDRINDEMFKFRHAMGVKQLGQADPKVKKQLDSLHKALFKLQKEMKSKGLTEASRKDLGMSSSVSKRRAGAELKQKLAGKRSDGMGKYTATIYGINGGKRVELKSLNDLNKFSKFELDEGKLTEAAKYKKGQKVIFQMDKGGPRPLKPATGTITKVQRKGNSYLYTIVDKLGPTPIHEPEITGLAEGNIKESVLRGQLAGDSASDMADLLRRYGVKKILKQPNGSVTYLQLNNASQGKTIVSMLKKMFGIKAQIDNHMYSPTPAVKFDNDQIAESKLKEVK